MSDDLLAPVHRELQRKYNAQHYADQARIATLEARLAAITQAVEVLMPEDGDHPVGIALWKLLERVLHLASGEEETSIADPKNSAFYVDPNEETT